MADLDLPRWSIPFELPEDAKHFARDLARLGIGAVVSAELCPPYRVEVIIVELPAQWIHAPSVVAREPFTSHPRDTEVDEHDLGRSSWWDRD